MPGWDLGCDTFHLNFHGFPKSAWTEVDWHVKIGLDFYILLHSLSLSVAPAAAFMAFCGVTPKDHNFDTAVRTSNLTSDLLFSVI
jgi:hypothetical protein